MIQYPIDISRISQFSSSIDCHACNLVHQTIFLIEPIKLHQVSVSKLLKYVPVFQFPFIGSFRSTLSEPIQVQSIVLAIRNCVFTSTYLLPFVSVLLCWPFYPDQRSLMLSCFVFRQLYKCIAPFRTTDLHGVVS